ncbi:hypothetical protein [Cryobacterium sp. TMT2-18-3]|uniref:hypothetical protein n=1 Tax=Cryobacterium sp. TMT2-18-3 TaxID=1259250 RepID=UPI00106DD158|nr:hypothetical protein [Cryobacterium sp. TMT2-18-3]TFC27573.1 hypothetical protein E3O22_09745 [Cryobacterium sp. TMT2-18-2]
MTAEHLGEVWWDAGMHLSETAGGEGRCESVEEFSAHLRGSTGDQQLEDGGAVVADDCIVDVIVGGVFVELILVDVTVRFGDKSAEKPTVISFGDEGESHGRDLEFDGVVKIDLRRVIDFGLRVFSEQRDESRTMPLSEASDSEAQFLAHA